MSARPRGSARLRKSVRRHWRSAILVAAVCLTPVIFWQLPASWNWPETRGAHFTLHFFDIGQGDSSLVQCGHRQALIDGGPSRAILRRLGRSMPFTDRRIEYVFLSHPHDDHFFGLFEVLRRYDVGQLILTEYASEHRHGIALVDLARRMNVPVSIARTGDSIKFGDCGEFRVLWPDARSRQVAESGRDSDNDLSLVMEFRSADGKPLALFTGDIGAEVEADIISNRRLEEVSILKVPHHGSRYSSSVELVRATRPEFAVVSVGENRFGHPSKIVLLRFEKASVKVFRTDESGNVVFRVSSQDGVTSID
jgi:competence protein ComEC